MKLTPTAIFGLVACLCIVVLYGWMIQSGLRKPTINHASTKDPAVTADSILNDQFFAKLQLRNTNGPLPITVTAPELGTSNPF